MRTCPWCEKSLRSNDALKKHVHSYHRNQIAGGRVRIERQWVLTVQREDGEITQEHNIRDGSHTRPQGGAAPVAALRLNPLLVPVPAPQQQPEAGTSRARPVVVGDSPPAKRHKSCSGAAAFPEEAGSSGVPSLQVLAARQLNQSGAAAFPEEAGSSSVPSLQVLAARQLRLNQTGAGSVAAEVPTDAGENGGSTQHPEDELLESYFEDELLSPSDEEEEEESVVDPPETVMGVEQDPDTPRLPEFPKVIQDIYASMWKYFKSSVDVKPRRIIATLRWRQGCPPNFSEFFENLPFNSSYRIGAQVGYLLRDKFDPSIVKGYYPSNNTSLFKRFRVVNSREQLNEFIDDFQSIDQGLVGLLERDSSSWVLEHVACTKFLIYFTPSQIFHPTGARVNIGRPPQTIPPQIKNNNHIYGLYRHVNGNGQLFEDNLCFFRALAMHRKMVREPTKTHYNTPVARDGKSLFRKYSRQKLNSIGVLQFQGVSLEDLPALETFFKTPINVYAFEDAMQISGLSNMRALFISKMTHSENKPLNLLVHDRHFSYIVDVYQASHDFRCMFCTKCFTNKRNFNNHTATCDGSTQHTTYQGGQFKPRDTEMDYFAKRNIHIAHSVYPYRAVFDFECWFDKEDIQQPKAINTKTAITAKQIPICSAVASNVPGFTKAEFFLDLNNPKKLVHDTLTYLENIADQAYTILVKENASAFNEIHKQIEIYNRVKTQEHEKSTDVNNPAHLEHRLHRYLKNLPVLSFNGGHYDLNLTKAHFFSFFTEDVAEESGSQKNTLVNVIKRGNSYMSIQTKKLVFLDITNYLRPGISYDEYLRAYGAGSEKLAFPYEWLDKPEKLNLPTLPPYECWFSSLKGKNIPREKYDQMLGIFQAQKMSSVAEFIKFYNIGDVVPFLDAIENQVSFFRDRGIDMFKDGLSISGLTLPYLIKTIPNNEDFFTVCDEDNARLLHLMKEQVVGGPSLIFHRFHRVGETFIRQNKEHICKSLIGYDANALYLKATSEPMPCNYPVIRHVANNFEPEFQSVPEGGMAHQFYKYLELQYPNQKMIHKFNGSEYRVGKRNIPVDVFMPESNTIFQFHGCFWHGHPCRLTAGKGEINLANDVPFKTLHEKTQNIEAYLIDNGFTVKTMYECEWRTMVQNDSLAKEAVKRVKKKSYFDLPTSGDVVTEADIIRSVENDSFFGLIQCDIHTPKELYQNQSPDDPSPIFSEVPPIFRNIMLGREHLSEPMLDFAEKTKNLTKPRKNLVSTYNAEGILLTSPLLKWYLQKGLKVKNIRQIIHYEKKSPFTNFAERITEARRQGDVEPDKQVLADVYKLMGNSAYGKTLTNVEGHLKVTYCREEDLEKHYKNPNFCGEVQLDENLFEISHKKNRIFYNLPAQIAFFVYAYAKLKLLEFIFDCIGHFLKRQCYQLISTDTDSLYMGLSTTSLIEAVKPELLHEFVANYNSWFCVPACSDHEKKFKNCLMKRSEWNIEKADKCCIDAYTFNKRTPGLFKTEWMANTPGASIVALCSKTYICTKTDSSGDVLSTKVSSKGLGRLNRFSEEDFLRVLESRTSGSGVNRGFVIKGAGIYSYEQVRFGLGFFYCKRRVLADCISTEPLRDPLTQEFL